MPGEAAGELSGLTKKRACELLGVPRSTNYYKPKEWKKTLLDDERRITWIDHVHLPDARDEHETVFRAAVTLGAGQ